MCDTLFKRTKQTAFFGKNSDRSANEPNLCLFYPSYTLDENHQCTYQSVGRVENVHSLLLVQPSWMWGGEMGINDCGVVIGNEAVFTKSSHKKQERLLGMDLLRLGLELSNNAKEAAKVIIFYLEKFGQGGNCGFDKHFYYDNSFLITDGLQTFILETNHKDWVLKEANDACNISNRLSISDDYHQSSKSFQNFQKQNTEPVFTYFSKSKIRQNCVASHLQKDLSIEELMALLRSHHHDDEQLLYKKGSVRSVCMHQSVLGDHTTASMIVDFHRPLPTIWLTGSSSPCLSLYKPCFFGLNVSPIFTDKKAGYDYWLKRELLLRAVFGGLISKDVIQKQIEEIQTQFILEEKALWEKSPSKEELYAFSLKCSNQEQAFVNAYEQEIDQIKNDYQTLSSLWQKKMSKLGSNVFITNFRERNHG